MTAALEDAKNPRDLYHRLTEAGLTDEAVHWRALTRIEQYRLPFAKTLACLSPGDRVLDWGCGNGHLSYFLTQNGFRTTGLSFEQKPAFLANEPLFDHVRGTNPVELPFQDASFDCVISMGVLEHVHETGGEQRESLKELRRVLRPGGPLLIFHLPNSGSWIEWLVRQLNRVRTRPIF